MPVLIKRVTPNSPAAKSGIKAGMQLISVNNHDINDVLDYMFYADEDMGLEFETFLMDDKHNCRNNCMFCFIDQLPPNLRKTLYFKDDDSRLSFLQGNYITLTNLSESDVERIVKMRTPVNVSVHTTNPSLRNSIMGNPNAGKALESLYKFADAGIAMNCQLVLCPEINDGDELIRTLDDLTALESVGSIACVPVGLTKFRENLFELRSFSQKETAEIIRITNGYEKVYAADEFYLTAAIDIPNYEHYGDFPQYENGVGMLAYMKQGFLASCEANQNKASVGKISIVTGTAAEALIRELVSPLEVAVYAIRNDFFGESITVSGLLTGTDIIAQLSELPKSDLGDKILIGKNSLNCDGVFLDGITPAQIESALGVKVCMVEPDGEALYEALF